MFIIKAAKRMKNCYNSCTKIQHGWCEWLPHWFLNVFRDKCPSVNLSHVLLTMGHKCVLIPTICCQTTENICIYKKEITNEVTHHYLQLMLPLWAQHWSLIAIRYLELIVPCLPCHPCFCGFLISKGRVNQSSQNFAPKQFVVWKVAPQVTTRRQFVRVTTSLRSSFDCLTCHQGSYHRSRLLRKLQVTWIMKEAWPDRPIIKTFDSLIGLCFPHLPNDLLFRSEISACCMRTPFGTKKLRYST